MPTELITVIEYVIWPLASVLGLAFLIHFVVTDNDH